jgi:hypothetical protein
MLVKFEEEDKKKQPLDNVNIPEALIWEKPDAEKEKYTPTEDDLQKLEEELIKVNESKFGVLVNELDETTQDEESNSDDEKKTLSYLRSHG